MSAAETIAKAIEKLEELRGESMSSPWRGWVKYNPLRGEMFGVEDGMGREVADNVATRDDAELIEVLHRTIDAQLAILQHVASYYAGDLGISTNRHVVALAEAIIGVDQ